MECIARQPEIAWAKLYTHRYICENYAWPRERSPQLQSVVPWMRYFGKKIVKEIKFSTSTTNSIDQCEPISCQDCEDPTTLD